jgi:tRNA (cmo5U34)-methyltransferase
MGQFHFTPDDYLDLMQAEVPAYAEFQDRVAETAEGLHNVELILDLGVGTGETARRVLQRFPGAGLVGIDVSEEMLAAARLALPPDRVDLRVRRLEDPLPAGPFDLVISALAIHHLDGAAKADLFQRVAAVLNRGARFVMGDVIVPRDPQDAVTPLTPDFDLPSSLEELEGWLAAAGFDVRTAWAHKDLVVLSCEARKAPT